MWQLLHPKHFVNVLLIQHMECSREKEILDFATIMKYGLKVNKKNLTIGNSSDNDSTSGFLEYFATCNKPKGTSESIKTNNILDIFQPFKNNDGSTTVPKFILIEGAPGMGKTTLCKEIAYQWAKQCLLKDTKLLFLFYLRDPAISNIISLKDFIHYFYTFDQVATELSERCAGIINDRDGEELTILFDGFDEFDSSNNSLISNILDRKVLPQCRIVVTSRLTASDRLRRMADVRVQVMGFTDESKIQYIKQELKDHPDKINKLQSYLNYHESIKSICYIPMMMTILVYVFKEKGQLPNNLTDLYGKFIALTISHHLQKQKKSEHLFISLQSLPEECKLFLNDLSKFAFLSLHNMQKVFSKEDIKNLCPNSVLDISDLERLGLLISVQYFCMDKGHTSVFNFLHLSIHEYLAAYYINSIDQDMQFNKLEYTFLNTMYQETWNIFSDMNYSTWLTFQQFTIYCKDIHRESLSRWITEVQSSSFSEHIIELYDTINMNTISNDVVQILFVESKQSCDSAAISNQEHAYLSLYCRDSVQQTRLDLFVINKVIKDLESNWYWKTIKKFSALYYIQQFLLLHKAIEKHIVDSTKLKTLVTEHIVLVDCHVSIMMIDAIKQLDLKPLLHFQVIYCTFELNAFTNFLSTLSNLLSILLQDNKFSVHNTHLPKEVCTELALAIESNQNLKKLLIQGNNMGSSADAILLALSKISSLQILDLQSNQLNEEVGELLASVIMNNKFFNCLLLGNNNIGKGMLLIAKALQHITLLELLDLSNNNIPKEVCNELALAVEVNINLEKVYLHNNMLSSSINVILNALCKISTLKVLALDDNLMPQETGKILASIITQNTGLEELHLNNNNLGIGSVEIAKALQEITSLKSLDLGKNIVPYVLSNELAVAIEVNKSLEKLWLQGNMLSSSINVILNALCKISTLKVLCLNDNLMPQETGKILASIITQNTRLEELHLNNNNLGIGSVEIAKALQEITSLKSLVLGKNNVPYKLSDELAVAIEVNKNLKTLWLPDNLLSSSINAILNALCKILTLKVLALDGNLMPQETGKILASIITHNTGLEELHLNNNNLGIGSVEIAKALQEITSLKALHLGKNKVPYELSDELAIAIEVNKSLEKLWLQGNMLSSSINAILNALCKISTLKVLDLDGNLMPQETGKTLAFIITHNTGLEELHLNNNSLGIGSVEIAKALQEITSLKCLGLGKNEVPYDLSDELAVAIEVNKSLEKLWLQGNMLSSSINVILNALCKISTLKVLCLNDNLMPQETGKILASIITQNTRLEELHLNNNNLGIGSVEIAKALQEITSLKSLVLGKNKVPYELSDELAVAIEVNKSLEKLWLQGNMLSSSINAILNTLCKISTLKVLALDGNLMPQETGKTLASIITHNTGLEELHFYNNNLGIGSVEIAKALQEITSLKALHLGKNKVPYELSDELAIAIEVNKSLEKLWLQGNMLSSSINAILNALCKISTLKVLDLDGNLMPQETGKTLAFIITHNTGIEELYLNNNNLGIGSVKIVKALQEITSLKCLGLGKNKVPYEVSDELAVAIEVNESLEKLWLQGNMLSSSINVILNALCKISTLKVLCLNDNLMPQETGKTLAFIITHNKGLEELHLNNNNLGIGSVEIAKALQEITTLKSLVLGKNKVPYELSDELAVAIEVNKSLKTLWLPDNLLSSSINTILNALCKISTLKVLDLDGNLMPQETGKTLAFIITHNTGLEELYLNNNSLGIGSVKIVKALQEITSLKCLGLGKNKVPYEVSDELAVAIEVNESLEKLWLQGNMLSSSINVILNALCKISTLKVLCLNDNLMPQETGKTLAFIITHNKGLEELHLNNNNLGIGSVEIAKALQEITSLKCLGLGKNKVPYEVSDELALAIEVNESLEKLWLQDNMLSSSINAILNALCKISTLKVLDLDDNLMPQETGKTLAFIITHNTGLEVLHLNNNSLGIGSVEIAKALQEITSLKCLGLDKNKVPYEVSDELAVAIEVNKSLEKLWLQGNMLSSSINVILNALCKISTLKVLNLDSNEMTQETGKTLALITKHNTGLEEMHLSNNNLGIGALELAKALQKSSCLKSLNLNNNKLPQEVCDELAIAIESNNLLEQLSLHCNNFRSLLVILQALLSVSNLNLLDLCQNSITDEVGNILASVISKNTELQFLQLSLVRTPLNVIIAMQNLSALQTLVFCTCNVSEEVEMNMAYVIINNKLLEWLSLPNINLSQNVILQAITTISNLNTLWLEDNWLSEEMSDDLSLAISKNASLERVILVDNMLQTGLMKIAEACNKLSNIQVLQLAHNCIIPSKVVELILIITQSTSLERVLLGGVTLNAAECFHYSTNEVLLKSSCVVSFNDCTYLEVIYLEMLRKQIGNDKKCFDDYPIYTNAENFSFAQKMHHYFKDNRITQMKVQETKERLEQISNKKMISSLYIIEKVKVIDLENNNIDEDASFKLATALHSNNVLEQLWLRGNKLNTAGALYILNSLEYLTTLQVLDMSYNNIGSQSADGIAAVIDNNPLINQLWLDGNDLHSTGTITICNALKKIRRLSILSLCNNGISDDAADELSAVITQNVLLEDLLLSNNQLHYIGTKIIAESLSKLIKLRKLDLFNNNIGIEGASSLTIVIQNSTSLQDLFLSGNNLETSGALEICNALSHINSLHVLTLSNNNISDEVTSQLIEVLNNNHLYALLIGGNGLECGSLKIAKVIENDNIAMQLLDYSNNNISEQDKEKIKEVFSKRANFKLYM